MTLLKVDLTKKVTCPNCNTIRPAGSTACSICGAALITPQEAAPTPTLIIPLEIVADSHVPRETVQEVVRSDPQVPAMAFARPAVAPLIQMDEELHLTKLPTHFLSEGQDPDLAHEGYNEGLYFLKQYGKDGEEIELIATSIERGSERLVECVIATDKRIIVYKKMPLGRLKIDDCLWQDVFNIDIQEEGNTITLVMKTLQDEELLMERLSQEQGRALVKYSAKRSEKIRNRVKELNFETQLSGPLRASQIENGRGSSPLSSPDLTWAVEDYATMRSVKSAAFIAAPDNAPALDQPAATNTKLQASVQSVLVTNKVAPRPTGSVLQNVMKAASDAQTQQGPQFTHTGSLLQNMMRASHAQQGGNTAPMVAPPQQTSSGTLHSIMRTHPQPDRYNSGPWASGSLASSPLSTPLVSTPLVSGPLATDPISPIEFTPATPSPREKRNLITGELATPDRDSEAHMSSGPLFSGPLPRISGPLSASEIAAQQEQIVQFVPATPAPTTPRLTEPAASQDDLVHKMKQLRSLLDAGFINQGEFDRKRAEILARL